MSNFYLKLTPNTFAVVRGPFKTEKEASKELQTLKGTKKYPKAYVKDASEIDLNGIRGMKGLSSQVAAAILGEIRIAPAVTKGGHTSYSLSYYSVDRGVDGSGKEFFNPKKVDIDLGSLWQLNTGPIDRMRICAELKH